MKDVFNTIEYRGKEYKMYFNLNVMQAIQEEYGSLEEWGKLTDGKNGEANAKAIIFGFTEMLNEGIDIWNEERGEKEPFFSKKQVARIISDIGLEKATSVVDDTVIKSTQIEDDKKK